MSTETKNIVHDLKEKAENGQAAVKSLISKQNIDKLKHPKVLWTAAGVAALIGAGVIWRLTRRKTEN